MASPSSWEKEERNKQTDGKDVHKKNKTRSDSNLISHGSQKKAIVCTEFNQQIHFKSQPCFCETEIHSNCMICRVDEINRG